MHTYIGTHYHNQDPFAWKSKRCHGIDALETDLRTALALIALAQQDEAQTDSANDVPDRTRLLLQMIQQEGHNLRQHRSTTARRTFAQQIIQRSFGLRLG